MMAKKRVVDIKSADIVSPEDAGIGKIYAFCKPGSRQQPSSIPVRIYQVHQTEAGYEWLMINASVNAAWYASTQLLLSALKMVVAAGEEVWQFDTWREFVSWALEKEG
jgi:hypothetical protein